MKWQRWSHCKVENLQKASPSYTLLIFSLSSPLLLGVYRDRLLIEKIESEKKTSEILLNLIVEAMDRYSLSHIIYVSGPGSHMAIKLTYIILKTMEIVRKIPFKSCSAFDLNDGRPIKAMGNLYFVKEKETIITQKFEQAILQEFALPASLEKIVVDSTSMPNYVLPAV